jgi:DNA-binding response OmpR family regulator
MAKKIMVVDDDKTFLEELGEILQASGYEVEGVSDPLTVLRKVNDSKPDLILMDLKMPGKSGFQLADELRHKSSLSGIPIIAISGFFTETEHALLMNLCGIRQCVKKPFNPTELIKQIHSVLDK